MDDADLEPFLRSSPRLERLVLTNCIVTTFLAERLLKQIRAFTKLKTLHISLANQGPEEDGWHDDASFHYWDYKGDVQKYPLHDGPNPLSREQMEQMEHLNGILSGWRAQSHHVWLRSTTQSTSDGLRVGWSKSV
ncbi:MAG: hypothetical protein Q9191_003801 [Dirinaria sp. TL-2023a]